MRFVYQYRTSDNALHEGVICASSREDAYARLKLDGIRPGRLYDAPGLWNKVWGRGKRWIAICVLSFVALGLLLYVVLDNRNTEDFAYTREGDARAISRRQIWGDATIIESAVKNRWRSVFSTQAERFLAAFAQPGVKVNIPYVPASMETELESVIHSRCRIEKSELEEYKQIKCIVQGMKDELAEYVTAGGSARKYIQRLIERQNAEVGIVQLEVRKIEEMTKGKGQDVMQYWHATNARLRSMGLPLIAPPRGE